MAARFAPFASDRSDASRRDAHRSFPPPGAAHQRFVHRQSGGLDRQSSPATDERAAWEWDVEGKPGFGIESVGGLIQGEVFTPPHWGDPCRADEVCNAWYQADGPRAEDHHYAVVAGILFLRPLTSKSDVAGGEM